MDLIKGEPERLLPVDSEHAALAMALRGERREDLKRVVLTGSGRAVPRLDAGRALQGVGEGGAPAPGVDHGAEDHDRLRHAHEQGPRGDRGALPVRPGLLTDPRVDPPGRRGACDGGVQGWQLACRDGSSQTCVFPSNSRSRGRNGSRPGCNLVPLTERALTFEPVDREAFPAVDLAYRVGGLGLTFPAVMNAANEVTHHLLPAFGSRRLEEITGRDIEDLKARLLDSRRGQRSGSTTS